MYSWLTFVLLLVLFMPTVGMARQAGTKTPAQVAQSLVDAFNARDMAGILAAYDPASTAYALPSGKVLLSGHTELRRKFESAFARDRTIKVEVVDRIVDGKFIIDKERITGTREGKPYESYSTVIYEIENGLIVKEWYLRK